MASFIRRGCSKPTVLRCHNVKKEVHRPSKVSTERRSDNMVGVLVLIWGALLMLEGLQITRMGSLASDTPYWLVVVAGMVVCLCGVAILIKPFHSRWRDCLAIFITGLMGSIGAWIALFAAESSISGNLSFLSSAIDVPLGRIAFGVGAAMCFAMSVYAAKLFIQKTVALSQT